MAAITPQEIKFYIEGSYNVLLQGQHGVGKTQMLREACAELGLKLKYYSASTMDPYTDFVGIPYPVEKTDAEGNTYRVLESVRPREIDEAEIVFFDEFNRADPKVLNAVMEMLQFRSINGTPLPHLKCIIAAQNPPEDEYNVISLDPAIVDRFDFVTDVSASPDKSYLISAFSKVTDKEEAKRVATALIDWLKEHKPGDNKYPEYISPRKIEALGKMYIDFTKRGVSYSRVQSAIQHAMPPGQTWDHGRLVAMLAGDPTQNPDNSDYDFSNADKEWLVETADPEAVAAWFKLEKDADKRSLVLTAIATSRVDHIATRWGKLLNHVTTKKEFEKSFLGNNETGKNKVRHAVLRFNIESEDQTPDLNKAARDRFLKWIPEAN